jgi:excinuclease UvrABC ATPase subunit
VAQGAPGDILRHPGSITGAYLRGEGKITVPSRRTTPAPRRVAFGQRGVQPILLTGYRSIT